MVRREEVGISAAALDTHQQKSTGYESLSSRLYEPEEQPLLLIESCVFKKGRIDKAQWWELIRRSD